MTMARSRPLASRLLRPSGDPEATAVLVAAAGTVLMLAILALAAWASLRIHAGRRSETSPAVRADCDAVLRMIDEALSDRRFSTTELRAVEDASARLRRTAGDAHRDQVAACVGVGP